MLGGLSVSVHLFPTPQPQHICTSVNDNWGFSNGVPGDEDESCNSSLYLTADDSEEDFLDAVEEQSNKKSGMITTHSNLLPVKYRSITSITFYLYGSFALWKMEYRKIISFFTGFRR